MQVLMVYLVVTFGVKQHQLVVRILAAEMSRFDVMSVPSTPKPSAAAGRRHCGGAGLGIGVEKMEHGECWKVDCARDKEHLPSLNIFCWVGI